jgi:hypothetical protein
MHAVEPQSSFLVRIKPPTDRAIVRQCISGTAPQFRAVGGRRVFIETLKVHGRFAHTAEAYSDDLNLVDVLEGSLGAARPALSLCGLHLGRHESRLAGRGERVEGRMC